MKEIGVGEVASVSPDVTMQWIVITAGIVLRKHIKQLQGEGVTG